MDEIEQLRAELQKLSSVVAEKQNSQAVSELVPSFMHEMNNLAGICITASSVLENRIPEASESFEKGTLKRSEMVEFLADISEASRLVSLNLLRIAEMVSAFKQVAIDNSHRQIRPFVLKSYLDEIIFSLRPKLKGSSHMIQLECSPQIEMYSSPGALALVIINLVLNSMKHGFGPGDAGHISISASVDDNDWVILYYHDDGAGILESDIPLIFNPFFTKQKGSSGLGLFTVHRMVTVHLKGSIAAENHSGKGAWFKIHIPRCLSF